MVTKTWFKVLIAALLVLIGFGLWRCSPWCAKEE